ncbi:hypothetical protein [Haloplanus aerogenes]|uniref:Uncharacterized protein n=1 Tax=Haloplanus aerogenes TaxID=660522 RepID=A0A3M0E2G2_9EURY|nr:hypothetical protein [Haloplanus aerogenes]AZH25889.1 hypothetical protein DU502_11100 [Haloplanus aerogenes]RMB25643.1 hypothetical protein ATH50_0740 [Haloplanus aerogenes]
MSTRLNVDYWSSLYPVYTNYGEKYRDAMECTQLLDRAESLWNWKGLNRSIPFDDIAPIIEQVDFEEYVRCPQQNAVESLSSRLCDHEILNSGSLVTPAFLLHLAASEPDQYSVKFPIYDRRVWNAYVYLWGHRGKGDHLYTAASHSPSKYEDFCQKFSQACPDGKGREYERALFMFGGFIMDIPPKDETTRIEKVDEILEKQEQALSKTQQRADCVAVDIDGVYDAR